MSSGTAILIYPQTFKLKVVNIFWGLVAASPFAAFIYYLRVAICTNFWTMPTLQFLPWDMITLGQHNKSDICVFLYDMGLLNMISISGWSHYSWYNVFCEVQFHFWTYQKCKFFITVFLSTYCYLLSENKSIVDIFTNLKYF